MASLVWQEPTSISAPPAKRRHTPDERRHTKERWEQLRDTITELFEDHDLDEVQTIMAKSHGFEASIPQYRNHLKSWGHWKYLRLTTEQWIFIAQQLMKRESEGKKTAFKLNGKPIPSSKVEKGLSEKQREGAFNMAALRASLSSDGISAYTAATAEGVAARSSHTSASRAQSNTSGHLQPLRELLQEDSVTSPPEIPRRSSQREEPRPSPLGSQAENETVIRTEPSAPGPRPQSFMMRRLFDVPSRANSVLGQPSSARQSASDLEIAHKEAHALLNEADWSINMLTGPMNYIQKSLQDTQEKMRNMASLLTANIARADAAERERDDILRKMQTLQAKHEAEIAKKDFKIQQFTAHNKEMELIMARRDILSQKQKRKIRNLEHSLEVLMSVKHQPFQPVPVSPPSTSSDSSEDAGQPSDDTQALVINSSSDVSQILGVDLSTTAICCPMDIIVEDSQHCNPQATESPDHSRSGSGVSGSSGWPLPDEQPAAAISSTGSPAGSWVNVDAIASQVSSAIDRFFGAESGSVNLESLDQAMSTEIVPVLDGSDTLSVSDLVEDGLWDIRQLFEDHST